MRKIEPRFTVKTLIEHLKTFDQDLPVIVSRDPEGNGFNSLECLQVDWFDPEYREVCEDEKDGAAIKVLTVWP